MGHKRNGRQARNERRVSAAYRLIEWAQWEKGRYGEVHQSTRSTLRNTLDNLKRDGYNVAMNPRLAAV